MSTARAVAHHGHMNQNDQLISIPEARAALGMIERNYSDSDIERIVETLLSAAEFAYENYTSESSET